MIKECHEYLDKEWLNYLPGLDFNRTFSLEMIKPAMNNSKGFKVANQISPSASPP